MTIDVENYNVPGEDSGDWWSRGRSSAESSNN